tara:strand:- start:1417 stop:1611 length:195 start_codon:yes stop_codon:yes gene_type:complete
MPENEEKEDKYYESMVKAEEALRLYQYLKRLERMGVDVSKVHIPTNNISKKCEGSCGGCNGCNR